MTAKRQDIQEFELQGFKYFKSISGMLEGLHDAGCERDKANNRKLHMDQYMSLIILYMFNPICTSLRAIQQASELKKVQKKLGCPRASLGSLSEATTVFDSSLMQEIIDGLATKLKPVDFNNKLDGITEVLTAVDGTLIPALSKMTWALWKTDKNAVKAHAQFDMQKHVPVKITVTEGNANEKEVLADQLESGRIYVKDRGYASLDLFQQIIDAESSFVCRLRDNTVYDLIEEYPVSNEAANAGIAFDCKVGLGRNHKTKNMLKEPVRLIAIRCKPHRKSNHMGRGGPQQGELILIATNRFDFDADVVALIYKHRWAIEVFFRYFKHMLGCRHLLSYNENGIKLQTYAAIIACMLISLWTGKKPTIRTYEMLCWYFTGMADLEELLTHISKLQNQH